MVLPRSQVKQMLQSSCNGEGAARCCLDMQTCHGLDASDASLKYSFRWMWAPRRAEASLLQFPTASLRNKYFLVEPIDFHSCLMSQHTIDRQCCKYMSFSYLSVSAFLLGLTGHEEPQCSKP